MDQKAAREAGRSLIDTLPARCYDSGCDGNPSLQHGQNPQVRASGLKELAPLVPPCRLERGLGYRRKCRNPYRKGVPMGRLPFFVLGFSLVALAVLACSPPAEPTPRPERATPTAPRSTAPILATSPAATAAPVPASQPPAQPVDEPTAPPQLAPSNPSPEPASPSISSDSAPVSTAVAPSGTPTRGPVPEPVDAVTFTSVSVGTPYACAVKTDGTVGCWRRASPYSSAPAPGGRFTSVSMGGHYGCGIRENGALACWVYDQKLGNGHGQAVPPDDGPFVSVAAGPAHSCAIKTDGSAVC